MTKEEFASFKQTWLENYRKYYKNGTKEEKRKLKDEISHNQNLNQVQKDKLWNLIVA